MVLQLLESVDFLRVGCPVGLEPRVPGPAMPACYPLSGGTLLFLVTASLLPWVINLTITSSDKVTAH